MGIPIRTLGWLLGLAVLVAGALALLLVLDSRPLVPETPELTVAERAWAQGWLRQARPESRRGGAPVTLTLSEAEANLLLAYREVIGAEVEPYPKGKAVPLAALLSRLLAEAGARSEDADPVAENRSALLALAAYVNGQPLPGGLPRLDPFRRPLRIREARLEGPPGRRETGVEPSPQRRVRIPRGRQEDRTQGLFIDIQGPRQPLGQRPRRGGRWARGRRQDQRGARDQPGLPVPLAPGSERSDLHVGLALEQEALPDGKLRKLHAKLGDGPTGPAMKNNLRSPIFANGSVAWRGRTGHPTEEPPAPARSPPCRSVARICVPMQVSGLGPHAVRQAAGNPCPS
jgi:hypothetical protein